ncbi:MAG: glycosyltransferase [Verrucomicrobiota bacterium]
MKVIHLSTSDHYGGAARAAYRIHQGLRNRGIDSTMKVIQKKWNDLSVSYHSPNGKGWHRIQRKWRTWTRNTELSPSPKTRFANDSFTSSLSPYPGQHFSNPDPSTILHVHWINGFVDLPTFLDSHLGKNPIVFTMHDMRLMTGGCHYVYECQGFQTECGACPQINSQKKEDLSSKNLRFLLDRKTSLEQGGVYLAANSVWMKQQAEQSNALKGLPIEVIHYGLDLKTFLPIDPAVARSALNLPNDSLIIMFAADGLHIERKGLNILVEALSKLNGSFVLLTAGAGQPQLPKKLNHIHLGNLEEDRLLALAYSAADFFVIPSKEEAFGQTSLEALACGTPVLGSNRGGIPDMIQPGINGSLVNEHTVDAWHQALKTFSEDRAHLVKMRSACRESACQTFSENRQAQDYLDLYKRCQKSLSLKT